VTWSPIELSWTAKHRSRQIPVGQSVLKPLYIRFISELLNLEEKENEAGIWKWGNNIDFVKDNV